MIFTNRKDKKNDRSVFRCLILAFSLLMFFVNTGWADDFSAWSYNKYLVFDNNNSDEILSDFPVLVVLDATRIDYGQCQAAGADIRFSASDGITSLSYEIEKWDTAGKSFIWVKVPSINANSVSDYIIMYWGNAGATDAQNREQVWSNGYEGVWHLNDDFEDSTINANHGTNTNSVDVTGVIGDGQYFDGDGDYITLPNSTSLKVISGDYTLEGWFYPEDAPSEDPPVNKNYGVLRRQDKNVGLNYLAGYDYTSFSVIHILDGGDNASGYSWADFVPENAYYIAGTVNRVEGRTNVYVNGKWSQKSCWPENSAGDTTQEAYPWLIGAAKTGGSDWVNNAKGMIDEIRISSASRSDHWIYAQHKSMTDQYINFYNTLPVCGVENKTPTNITDTAVTLNGAVISVFGDVPIAHMCWGTSDGGADPSAWDNDETLGPQNMGTFSLSLSSLGAGTYYYRAYITGTSGTGWAAQTGKVNIINGPSISINENPDALRNPFKGVRPGYIGWNNTSVNHPYAGLIRHYIGWSEIESNASDGVDKIRAFCNTEWANIQNKNIKIIPRVYLYWPEVGGTSECPVGDVYWPDDMDECDYSSQQFKDRVVNLIQKLGEAWDDDPRVAYIQLGLIGPWGEQHHPHVTAEVETLIGNAVENNFHNKHITIRHYWDFPGHTFGIYWDSFAHFDREWMGHSLKSLDLWKTKPIGGETAYEYGNYAIQPGDDQTDTLADPVHTNYLINTIRNVHANNVGVSNYEQSNPAAVAGAINVQKALGYRFVVDTIRYKGNITPGQNFTVGFSVQNTGSSPFYYNWPVEVSLLDTTTHELVWNDTFTGLDVRQWLPGDDWDETLQVYRIPAESYNVEGTFTLPSDIPDGEYIIALAILDPAGNLPCVKIAVENYFHGGRHPMGKIGVNTTVSDPVLPSSIFEDPKTDDTLYYEVPIPSCTPPDSGTWIVDQPCTLEETYTAPESVEVIDAALLTVAPGASLNVDCTKYHLSVQDGSGVLIKDGANFNCKDPRLKYEGDNPFAWVDGSEPDMPVWDSSLKGWTVQAGDTREQIVIDQTFTVAAGDEAIFDNKIVWVRPSERQNIEIYGTLTIRNSLFLWDQTEHQQAKLVIQYGGTLNIENSYVFSHNQYWINWEYGYYNPSDEWATVNFNKFVGDPWTSGHGKVNYTANNFSTVKLTIFHDTNESTYNITNAHHVWTEFILPEGSTTITFPEKRQWTDWNLDTIWPNSTVHITDSYLYERDIGPRNNTHITVVDSAEYSGGWGIYNESADYIDCELRDIGDPINDEPVYYANKTWDLPCNNSSLTLINSYFRRSWPTIGRGKVHLKVYNTNCADVRNFSGEATYEMYDSLASHVAVYNGGKFYLENVQIRYDIEAKGEGSIVYGYNVTSKDPNNPFEVIEVDGGQYIELSSPGVPW